MGDQHFDPGQLSIIGFCAKECELQRSGELSVGWMVEAWNYAATNGQRPLDEQHILALGALVEPRKNGDGYRRVGVRVGWDVKMDWADVPTAMTALVASQSDLSPEAFFYEYETVHPFRDGNGRTGVILYNWLRGSLGAPVWAPNYWDDERRFGLPVAAEVVSHG